MVLGRLVHYSADILFLSTILAGIKQTSGYTCVLPPCPMTPS